MLKTIYKPVVPMFFCIFVFSFFISGCEDSPDTAGLYTLSVSATGIGSVTADPSKDAYEENEEVILTASAGSDYIFDSWNGDAAGANSSVTIIMDSNKSINAVFKQLFDISIVISGSGSVSCSPDKSEYIDGEEVTLTAVPDTDNAFLKWSGDVTDYCMLTKTVTINDDLLIEAEFIPGSAYYVRSGAGGDGTIDNPWGDIQTALENVATPTSVFIAAGTYSESITPPEGVSLYGGFTSDFSGRGFETATERSNSSYKTLIENPSTTGSGTNIDPVAAVIFDGSSTIVTNATVIEGFTINSGVGDFDAGIRCKDDASPAIRYNTITGIGDGTNTHGSYGIYSRNSSPVISYNNITGNTTDSFMGYAISCGQVSSSMKIDHNTIYGGDNCVAADGACGIDIVDSAGAAPVIEYNDITGGMNSTVQSIGIYSRNCSSVIRYNSIQAGTSASGTVAINCYTSTIYNNIIHGGTSSGTGGSIGIFSGNDAPYIVNNTICGGSGTVGTHAINGYLSGQSIINNIIFCEASAAGSVGIYATNYLQDVHNNNIFDCASLFHFNNGGSHSDYFNIPTLEAFFPFSQATGNISVDLIDNGGIDYLVNPNGEDDDMSTLDDNNWHLVSTVSTDVSGGGRNESGTLTDDYDGIARTAAAPVGTNTGAAGWSMGAYEEE